MILVEVSVPALGHSYDFELEETARVELLIREMVETICQKERLQAFEEGQPFSLYSPEGRARLDPQGTLARNGVRAGQQLLLL